MKALNYFRTSEVDHMILAVVSNIDIVENFVTFLHAVDSPIRSRNFLIQKFAALPLYISAANFK